MRSAVNKIGLILLVIGILTLVAGLVMTMTVGTFAVPVLVTSSIIINSIGITMIRHKKD